VAIQTAFQFALPFQMTEPPHGPDFAPRKHGKTPQLRRQRKRLADTVLQQKRGKAKVAE
jgi:hypothetical protein